MFEPHRSSPGHTQARTDVRPSCDKNRPSLAVNTNVVRHRGQTPRQVYPYESKTQELSFISFADIKALKKSKLGSLKQQLENRLPIRPGAQRSISDSRTEVPAASKAARVKLARSQTAAMIPSTAEIQDNQTSEKTPLEHKRVRGLKPSPLDLAQDISPSDQAITIGLAIPSAELPNRSNGSTKTHPLRQVEDVQTPTIVITPAKEDFDLPCSTEDQRCGSSYRPTSSIYSRYTNCATRNPSRGHTPPVPPLPLFAARLPQRESTTTLFEEEVQDDSTPVNPKRLTSQSKLPTPRRSRGWWNLITSPFSAKSNTHFFRSPPPADDDDSRIRVLDDAADMGVGDPHSGIIFLNRAANDEELRTALPPDTGSTRPPVPKRSDTAPGALDNNAAQLNIYQVPRQGLAAAYYDGNRHFPSPAVESGVASNLAKDLAGWSPSQSVAHPEDDKHFIASPASAIGKSASDVSGNTPIKTPAPEVVFGCAPSSIFSAESEGPFADPRGNDADPAPQGRNVFSTPSESELKYESPPRPANERSNTQATQATATSVFSPLTATPVVEEAHTARLVGLDSDSGELRQVELTPARTSSPLPPASGGLGAVTMASRDAAERRPGLAQTLKAPFRSHVHARSHSSGSVGLGIMEAENEKEIFPPPRLIHQQTRLGTDRFGQLELRSLESDKDARPWFKRFFWMLVSVVASLLLLTVVLLVVFVPQSSRNGMAVQAEWLNLTGFPALPTGISTVVQPTAEKDRRSCVSPSSLWSCAIPMDQAMPQSTPSTPNFRFEIRFRNGTAPANETQLVKRSGGPAEASALVKRNAFQESLYEARPRTPDKDDQLFLGKYTDNVSEPYNGEETPFYLTLLDPSSLGARTHLDKRQDPYPYPTKAGDGSTPSSNSSTKARTAVPEPATNINGKAADASLYPFAQAQPLRLFNRGQAEEHYGFYTYFDRTLFVSNLTGTANGTAERSVEPDDSATALCTWSQTRMRVQLWTRQPAVAALADVIPLKGLPAVNSTANDMTTPGSFPYAVTVTLDRHGGEAKEKGVYCYGLDENQKVMEDVRMWIHEDREADGSIVSPAAVPGSNGTALAQRALDGFVGVDGGDGGCACQWKTHG